MNPVQPSAHVKWGVYLLYDTFVESSFCVPGTRKGKVERRGRDFSCAHPSLAAILSSSHLSRIHLRF